MAGGGGGCEASGGHGGGTSGTKSSNNILPGTQATGNEYGIGGNGAERTKNWGNGGRRWSDSLEAKEQQMEITEELEEEDLDI